MDEYVDLYTYKTKPGFSWPPDIIAAILRWYLQFGYTHGMGSDLNKLKRGWMIR